MISRWLIMSEHFVKSDCLRLEKIETSIVLQFAREIICFVSFFFVSVSRLFETFDFCSFSPQAVQTRARL